MNKPLDRIAFEYWAGVGSKVDFESWVESELRKEEPHPDVYEMFNLSEEEAEKQSLRLAAEILEFEPISEKGEEWAKELLKAYCEKLLKEEITPFEFCRLVNLFDTNFLGLRKLDDGSLEYPEWLGDLRSTCDWCHESWILSNSPLLAEEAKKVMKNEALQVNQAFTKKRRSLMQSPGGLETMLHLQVADWHIECDPDATRRAYAPLPIGTDCSCDQCRNFNAAAGKTFPPEFATLAASMGIDLIKPAELMHWCREPSGLYLTGGWFHFVGRIVSGADATDFDTGIIQYQQLAPGIEIGLTRETNWLPETFLSYGQGVAQLEFQTHVPWVLADVEPAP